MEEFLNHIIGKSKRLIWLSSLGLLETLVPLCVELKEVCDALEADYNSSFSNTTENIDITNVYSLAINLYNQYCKEQMELLKK